MTSHSLPTRALPPRPDLEQLKRQAKELLRSFVHSEAAAVAEVTAHYHAADPATFALHDAQLVLARAYGFDSWPHLKAFVDGATVKRLIDAVRSRNMDDVRSILNARPELAGSRTPTFKWCITRRSRTHRTWFAFSWHMVATRAKASIPTARRQQLTPSPSNAATT